MASDKFEQALTALDPEKRELLKRIVAGAAFAVPTLASFAVSDLAQAQVGSCVTVTATKTGTITTVTTTTTRQTITITSTTITTTSTPA